jgi:hypothetical protein
MHIIETSIIVKININGIDKTNSINKLVFFSFLSSDILLLFWVIEKKLYFYGLKNNVMLKTQIYIIIIIAFILGFSIGALFAKIKKAFKKY